MVMSKIPASVQGEDAGNTVRKKRASPSFPCRASSGRQQLTKNKMLPTQKAAANRCPQSESTDSKTTPFVAVSFWLESTTKGKIPNPSKRSPQVSNVVTRGERSGC